MIAIVVQVVANAQGEPQRLRYRGRWHQVAQITDAWEEAGRWWRAEEIRRVFRVLTTEGVAYELHCQPSSGWQLAPTVW